MIFHNLDELKVALVNANCRIDQGMDRSFHALRGSMDVAWTFISGSKASSRWKMFLITTMAMMKPDQKFQ